MTNNTITSAKMNVVKGFYVGTINYKDEQGNYRKKKIFTKLKERGNKKEADRILNEAVEKLEKQLKEGKKVEQQTQKQDDVKFLDYIGKYIENKEKTLQPEVYDTYFNCYKIMCLYFDKDLKLKDVTYKDLLGYYDYLRNERKNKNVAIKHHAVILSPALREAYRDDLIPKNPYEFMPHLKREKAPMKYYDRDEIENLFKYTDKTSIGLIVRVAAYYGFRRSELIGLKWKAIDFNKKVITIEHKVVSSKKIRIHASDTLKTKSSNRTLPLFEEIEKMLLDKKQQIETNRKLYGMSYNQKFLEYVFVDDMGDLILPDYVTSKFSKILKTNKLKHIRFHDLRHSCASLLVANGVPMKNIQEWLGHANYNTTADVYSHLDFSAKEKSAKVIEDALSIGKNKTEDVKLEDEIEQLKKLIAEKEKLLKQKNEEMS